MKHHTCVTHIIQPLVATHLAWCMLGVKSGESINTNNKQKQPDDLRSEEPQEEPEEQQTFEKVFLKVPVELVCAKCLLLDDYGGQSAPGTFQWCKCLFFFAPILFSTSGPGGIYSLSGVMSSGVSPQVDSSRGVETSQLR